MLVKNAVTFLPLTLASQLSIQLDSSSENFEIGSSQEISCQYSHQIEGDLPYELTWSKNNVPFVSLNHFDDYQAIPVISSAVNQNVDISRYNFNNINNTFSLEFASVEIEDQGQYSCSVKILKAQPQEDGSLAYLFESASTEVKVFANPTVSFNYENAGSFDIRAGQVENNNLALENYLIGYCHVENAYPSPDVISVQVGNQPAFTLSLDSEAVIVDEVTNLMSYSNLQVNKIVTGADHLASVSCVAESEFYKVASEIDVESSLNVQYLPEDISCAFSNAEGENVEVALAGENLTVTCSAESNPEVILNVFEYDPSAVVAVEDETVDEANVEVEPEVSEEVIESQEEVVAAEESNQEATVEEFESPVEAPVVEEEEISDSDLEARRKRRETDNEVVEEGDHDHDHEYDHDHDHNHDHDDEAEPAEEEYSYDYSGYTDYIQDPAPILNIQAPAAQEDSVEEPVVEEPAVEEPVVEEPEVEESEAEVVDQPVVAAPVNSPSLEFTAAESGSRFFQCDASSPDFTNWALTSQISIQTISISAPVLTFPAEAQTTGTSVQAVCQSDNVNLEPGNSIVYTLYFTASESEEEVVLENFEIIASQETAGSYRCSARPAIDTRIGEVFSEESVLLVENPCGLVSRQIAYSFEKSNQKIISTLTCPIQGDNCKAKWVYSSTYFGRGRTSGNSITFTDMPSYPTDLLKVVKCYAESSTGEKSGDFARLAHGQIQQPQSEGVSTWVWVGAIVIVAIIYITYKRKQAEKNHKKKLAAEESQNLSA